MPPMIPVWGRMEHEIPEKHFLAHFTKGSGVHIEKGGHLMKVKQNSPSPQPLLSKGASVFILAELVALAILTSMLFPQAAPPPMQEAVTSSTKASDSNASHFIKWVDFNVTADAMRQALRLDVDSYGQDVHPNWLELLAYLGARYGGDFSRFRPDHMDDLVKKLQEGATMESLTADMKYYPYYLEAYSAVLGGMVGTYDIQIPDEAAGEPIWVTKYGLKAFSPIAKNYPYQDFDDFGVSRSYGFKRQHLGHDLMGQVGTPVIAVESGYVEAMGWNQYGGWRLGIRSFDQKRYYYYAHLRKNYPYHKTLKEGSYVQAGDVIGYLGRTGYSRTENTNNINEPHLHFGMQLIFDESQKEGNNEIWIDCYELVKFLAMNRSETVKNQETKEYYRVYQMKDPAIPGGAVSQSLH